MKLEEFLFNCQSDIDNFRKEWLHGQKIIPEHYPEELPLGEWFEQYLAYLIAGN